MEAMAEENIRPKDLVHEEHIKKVLLADKGKNAKITSWKLVSFTKSGDNYACAVIGLEIKYSMETQDLEDFYVVKLNPQRRAEGYDQLTQDIFFHESEFYMFSLPNLNEVLESIGHPLLNFPRCFHRYLEMNKEQLYFEDLRKRGFQLFDRKKGMSLEHAKLVLRELARLHSSSLLLQIKTSKPIEVTHEFLQKDLFEADYCQAMMFPMMKESLSNSQKLLEQVGGYEKAIDWIEDIKPQIEDVFTTQLKTEGFNVICHGDCWNNNILFRHGSDGVPQEVMLIDLQMCRKASLATDLNYFMYTSIASDVRKPHLRDLLDYYHSQFKEVADGGGMPMPFSKDELMKEFRSKNNLGAIFGMMISAIILLEPDDVPDMEKLDGDFVKMIEEINVKSNTMLHTNPLFKSRFLGNIDEFMETGLIH